MGSIALAAEKQGAVWSVCPGKAGEKGSPQPSLFSSLSMSSLLLHLVAREKTAACLGLSPPLRRWDSPTPGVRSTAHFPFSSSLSRGPSHRPASAGTGQMTRFRASGRLEGRNKIKAISGRETGGCHGDRAWCLSFPITRNPAAGRCPCFLCSHQLTRKFGQNLCRDLLGSKWAAVVAVGPEHHTQSLVLNRAAQPHLGPFTMCSPRQSVDQTLSREPMSHHPHR